MAAGVKINGEGAGIKKNKIGKSKRGKIALKNWLKYLIITSFWVINSPRPPHLPRRKKNDLKRTIYTPA